MPARLRVFITGASSGIGSALAREYATQGAVLGLTARRRGLLDALATDIGGGAFCYAADVRDTQAMAEAARSFIAQAGVPDIVIANAGIAIGTLTQHAEDIQIFQDIIDTNLLGVVKTFQPFIAPMSAAGHGALVGMSSVASFRGLPGASAYSASKAALNTYMESLRVELRGSGVDVITICPGYIRTPMTAVNPYPMPFIISAQSAARKIIEAIASRKKFAVLPWQMAVTGAALRMMPRSLYALLFAKAPHKPRKA
ncbi:MAG: SDR family oxidoreductase [Burkholderiales bacterium]